MPKNSPITVLKPFTHSGWYECSDGKFRYCSIDSRMIPHVSMSIAFSSSTAYLLYEFSGHLRGVYPVKSWCEEHAKRIDELCAANVFQSYDDYENEIYNTARGISE